MQKGVSFIASCVSFRRGTAHVSKTSLLHKFEFQNEVTQAPFRLALAETPISKNILYQSLFAGTSYGLRTFRLYLSRYISPHPLQSGISKARLGLLFSN